MKKLNVDDAINDAARDLPKGWTIVLIIENGAAWLELYDTNGEKRDIRTDYMSPIEMINEALLLAIELEKELWPNDI